MSTSGAISPDPAGVAGHYWGSKNRTHLYYLLGALLIGLLVRVPGVFWGHNFPTGWYGHHVDEYTHLVNAETLINPLLPPRWPPHPYPKGMAVHVAVPMLGVRALEGNLFEKSPPPVAIITAGRVVSVLYGTATILVVFLFAGRLFRDSRVAPAAAWIFALGGLHVSQSHYFLSDVPALFWFLLGSYLLLLDAEVPEQSDAKNLWWAAFCFGAAFGLKMVVFGLPSLGLVALLRQPRLLRAVHAGVFFLAGFVVINFGSYTPYDLFRTLARGVSDPYQFSLLANLFLYFIEFPSIVSLPVAILCIVGSYFLVRKHFGLSDHARRRAIWIVIVLPLLINIAFVIFKLDHFPRHMVPFIPWISMVAAWSLVAVGSRLRSIGWHPALVVIPLFAYLALFVYDGERVFLNEPRNRAARWLQENVVSGTAISWFGKGWMKDYEHVEFPNRGRPPVVVIEMHHANHYLSGMSWKNSFPEDYRFIFASRSQAWVEARQSLFRGTSEYKEVARFSEGYFMPEYVLTDRLIGNRSRNYVAEIVIFAKEAGEPVQAGQP